MTDTPTAALIAEARELAVDLDKIKLWHGHGEVADETETAAAMIARLADALETATQWRTSRTEFRNVIAEEFSWLVGKCYGMRPCGDDQSSAVYYRKMPAKMRAYVDQCADRIAVRLTWQSPETAERVTQPPTPLPTAGGE